MNLVEKLSDRQVWQSFYNYKAEGGHTAKADLQELEQFIAREGYLAPVRAIREGGSFAPPVKKYISKKSSSKKRIVYTFSKEENYVLKLLTWLLADQYDCIFAHNLYSFRRHQSAKHAIRALTQIPHIDRMWAYKVDVSNYFNSIPVHRLLPVLEETLAEEPEIEGFLKGLLQNRQVWERGQLLEEDKGIMAGTPISTFLANLYLSQMDHRFAARQKIYARYSDDIIVFAPTREELDGEIEEIRACLQEAGLSVNPDKEEVTAPGERWTFLGISYHRGVVDVSPVSLEKLKAKMRRKTRALKRWQAEKGLQGIHAAKAFVRVMNRKLLDNDSEHELTWVRWYFPLINTTRSLAVIDGYSQDCIRYLATGKRTKGRFDFRYEQMKEIGYVSLVNCYYKHLQSLEQEKE